MRESPGARVTGPERERALRELADQLSAGRLTLTEFEQRTAEAAAAVHTPELAALFADLPAPDPPPPPAETADVTAALRVVAGVAAVGTLLFAVLFGGWLWLLLLVVVLAGAPLIPGVLHRRVIGRS